VSPAGAVVKELRVGVLDPNNFFILVFLTSVLAGGVGAILGIGGGMLLVPILTMFFGVRLRYAMGASIVSVIATSSGAAALYLRSQLTNIRLGLFLVIATTTGAITGAYLAGVVPMRVLEFILGLALGYSALATFQQIRMELPGEVPRDRIADYFRLHGTYHDVRLGCVVPYQATHVGRGFGIMYGAGVLSGLLGIGSGAFKVLAMDYFMRLPMKVSTATSNFMIGITAAASAGVYFSRGDVHPLVAAPVALGVLLGANLGTRLMTRMRNTTVRKAFLPVLLYLSGSMLLRGIGAKLW
jgi:uncharacterized membrane protein YfcA